MFQSAPSTIIVMLVRGAFRIGALIPIRVNHFFARLLGHCLAKLPLTITKNTAINLKLCLPHLSTQARQILVKHTLIENCKTFLELPNMWHGKPQSLLNMIDTITGEEQVKNALAQKKGLILLGPHLGAFELLNVYLSTQYQMLTLYRPPKKPYLEPLMKQARERLGSTLLPTNAQGVKMLYKALLKNKRIIGILPDQDPGESGALFAPFFKQQTWTMTLVTKLAAKSQAPVFYVYALRNEKGRYDIVFRQADKRIIDTDPLIALTAMNQGIEACVKHCPSQYQWPYKRFKRQPEGIQPPY